MKIEVPAEFMQVSTESGGEALDRYEGKPWLDESVPDELSDEQCLRELVESLVRIRSEEEVRKSPRFATPASLTYPTASFALSRVPVPPDTHDFRNRTPKSRYDLQNLRFSEPVFSRIER